MNEAFLIKEVWEACGHYHSKSHSIILFSFSKSHLHCSCHLPKYTHKMTLSVCVWALLQAQERRFGRLWIKSVILVNSSCIYSNYYVTPAPINNPLCDNIKSWEKNVGEVRLSLMKPDARCVSQSAIERLWQKDGNLENKSSRDLQWWQNCFENTNGKVSKSNNTVPWIFRNYSEYY